jgi:hypothetical protein
MKRRGEVWRASRCDWGTVSMARAEGRMAWQDGETLVISGINLFESGSLSDRLGGTEWFPPAGASTARAHPQGLRKNRPAEIAARLTSA